VADDGVLEESTAMESFKSKKGSSHMGSVITETVNTVNNHGLYMSGNQFSGPVNILGSSCQPFAPSRTYIAS
jgi:hypothetical protein